MRAEEGGGESALRGSAPRAQKGEHERSALRSRSQRCALAPAPDQSRAVSAGPLSSTDKRRAYRERSLLPIDLQSSRATSRERQARSRSRNSREERTAQLSVLITTPTGIVWNARHREYWKDYSKENKDKVQRKLPGGGYAKDPSSYPGAGSVRPQERRLRMRRSGAGSQAAEANVQRDLSTKARRLTASRMRWRHAVDPLFIRR